MRNLRKNGFVRFSELFELHSRGCKKAGDSVEDICVASRRVIESRGVNQNDAATVQIKRTRDLYGACAGSQPIANDKVGSADEIDELCGSRPGQGGIHNELAWQYTTVGDDGGRQRTVDFPLPVAPMMLSDQADLWIVPDR